MKFFYLLIDFFTLLVPFVFSFHPRINFYKNWPAFFTANISVAILFVVWDIYFTHQGVWGFNTEYTIGISLFKLPVEEVLFFICIPYSCVFTYHCLTRFFRISWNSVVEHLFMISFSIALLITGFVYIEKQYTSFTFISLGLLLPALKYGFRMASLPQLFSIYAVLLVPFFIVNGLLTGAWNNQVVVWYNPEEIIGIRLGTIPVEDVFYGLELIVLNVFVYERLLAKNLSQ